MKKILLFFLVTVLVYGCDNDNYHDTGLAKGYFDGSVWEYMHSNHEWDSAVVIIERAGLTDIFNGTDPEYRDGITFFGFTNFTVWQFLAYTADGNGDRLYRRISDIPVELCKRMVLDYLVKGKKMKESFDYEVKGTLTGGTTVETLSGKKLRVYRTKSPDPNTGVPDKGPESMAIHALASGQMAPVASADNRAGNGVVHSLSYTFQWTEL